MLVLFVWVLVVIWLLGCFVGVVVGVVGVCGFACVGYGVRWGVCVLRVWVVLEWYWMLVCSPGVRDLFAFLLVDVSVNCWWWVSCWLVGVRLLCLSLFGSCLFGG